MNINLTLIGQMVFFALFVLFCMKYVWPPIMNAMKERADKIADGLAAADRASHDLELAQEKAVERLKEAKEEAEREAADAENAKRAAELEASGKRATGGLHKFDASEVDVHGGNATADDFLDAFGF